MSFSKLHTIATSLDMRSSTLSGVASPRHSRAFGGHLDGGLGPVVEVLLGQPEKVVAGPLDRLEIPASATPKHPGVQQFREPVHVATLQLGHAGLVALVGVLVRDGPIFLRCPRHPQHRGENVLLADEEGRDVDELVPEPGQRRTAVVRRVLRQDLHAHQLGHGPPGLVPGAGVDLGVAVVIKHHAPVLEVEPVPHRRPREAVLVPEPTHQGHAAQPCLFDEVSGLPARVGEHGVLGESVVGRVRTPVVGHDPGNTGFDGGVDQRGLRVRRHEDAQGDEESVLAPKGVDYRGRVAVVDLGHFDPSGQLADAVGPRDGRDIVLAGREKVFCKVTTDLSASLG